MRRVTFKSVMDRIAGYMGEADGLQTEDATLAVVKINFFVRLAWHHYWWPELMDVQKRYLRELYADGSFIEANDERYFPQTDTYYQALQEQAAAAQPPALLINGVWTENSAWWAACSIDLTADDWTAKAYAVGDKVHNPADDHVYQCISAHTGAGSIDLTKFAILNLFVSSIDYDQADQDALGDVRFVWTRDPRVYPQLARRMQFLLRTDGIQIPDCRVSRVYVEYRRRPVYFTIQPWQAGTAYDKGDVVYSEPDCYQSAIGNNSGDPDGEVNWNRVEFPEIFAEFAAQSAYAMLSDREQEQPENFSVQMAAGYPLLVAELDKIERQQGQTRQLHVVSGRG